MWFLRWLMPALLSCQFSLGKSCPVEHEKGGGHRSSISKVKVWALELIRIINTGSNGPFLPLSGSTLKTTNCSDINYKWITCLLTKLKIFSSVIWMNVRKEVLTCCIAGERISVCRRRKQSSHFCFANIIVWLTHRPAFSGSKIQLHTLLLSCAFSYSSLSILTVFFWSYTHIFLGIQFSLTFEAIAAKSIP